MALITAIANEVELRAVRANNAAEMQLRLTEALATIETQGVVDLQLAGCGAAPNFLALLVATGAEGATTPTVAPADAIVFAADAIDPIELSEQIQAELLANGVGGQWYRAISAGGGWGPHWMGIALYSE